MSDQQGLAYVLIGASLVAQLILVSLQLAAARRHGHRSFFLLCLSTACGIAYLALLLALGKWRPAGYSWPPLLYTLAALYVGQLVLGVWGTASLFGSYRKLAGARSIR